MASTTITKFAHLQIPLEDVVKATNNFHHDNVIGHGDFGPAYKGQLLRSGTLMKISARRLERNGGLGDSEFWTEVSVLSELDHTNLISIIGYCDEKGEKIIITTYEANGSLGQFLKSPNLTWIQRLKICVGVARAMSYLHSDEGRGNAIIHRNINSCTILLDKNWEAKLSGFEISIKQSVYRKDQVRLCEHIGTLGYMDPAIEKTGGVTHKSDIYSFGVVLLEILCGRKAIIQNEDHRFLATFAKYYYENRKIKDIIHPDLQNQMSLKSLTMYLQVAFSCIEEERAHRSNMDHVADQLEKALEFQTSRDNLVKNLEHLKIYLSDIKLATDDFSPTYKIEFTSYYSLYRTELDQFYKKNSSSIDGKENEELPKRRKTVVIKRILHGDDEAEGVFYREIEMLTSVKHHNIVTLLGFCVEGSEMILVIDKVSNGYLAEYWYNIKDKRTLTWEKRLKICIDIANALNYLHYEREGEKIINRDIKSEYIGLDENWGANIADFGLSLFVPPDQKLGAFYPDAIAGTPFYLDPDYETTWMLKKKSDVYSFGVVLLEILCGRLAYHEEYDKGLASTARRCFKTGTIKELIDPIIMNEQGSNNFILNKKDSLDIFVNIAIQCVAETQNQRPTMKVVLKELEKALFFQVNEEELVQRPDKDQLVDEEFQFSQENLEEPSHSPNTDQVVDKHEKVLELQMKHENPNLEHLKICLSDVLSATENFSPTYKIGFSTYYSWHITELDHFDLRKASSVEEKNKGKLLKKHNTVLLKRVLIREDEEGEHYFFRELAMLTSVKHPNIVTLLGFCDEDFEKILVLEHYSNGYLSDYWENLNKRRNLTWEKRLKICIDVAHALNYLHSEMEDEKIIIHRDIRSETIVLDENWGAKISYFGAALFLPPNQKDEALYPDTIDGPYIDPEYKKTGKLKRESDVYSFGIVLFEILFGTTAYDTIYYEKDAEGLGHVARQSYSIGTLQDFVDPFIKEESGENIFVLNRGPNNDSLQTFIEIAYQCVAETQDQRPTMKVVVKELEKALSFQENSKENPIIALKAIKVATQNFHVYNLIGRGGYGKVYKGKLQDGDGFKDIVSKRLDKKSHQGEQQFLSELQILWEYKHQNIIGLVGYCDEKDEKIIVYEYASRGSLERYLNNACLTWIKRLNICIEVASALDFLHGGAGRKAKVVHRDIKAANILLNHEWNAKLADFGLSLISPITRESDYVINRACGTQGYVDPHYSKSGFLTIESDIYSFGVVMFEILFGIKTYEIHKSRGHYLPDFIKNKFEEGKHDEVVFEQIRAQIMPKSLTTFQEIAYQCLHDERRKRPTTKDILTQLQKALKFQEEEEI